ncbi:hypothetical protein C1H46_033794 [Malus baccata]|uniref:Uncharacterized protein n=1 Tax=Malus baccata TaxID=106549 RepID=A0A540L2E3_MALBA|nr:hypothetical protein C1H46_033794 [Malus baccata]
MTSMETQPSSSCSLIVAMREREFEKLRSNLLDLDEREQNNAKELRIGSKVGRSSFCSISPKPEFCKDFPRTCTTWQQNAIPKRPCFVSSSLQQRREPSPDPSEPSAAALKHLSDSDNKGNASSTEPGATAGT